MYIKYKLQKKQVSHDGGVTWVDVVPLEERVGESAGTYSTLEECEGDYSTQYFTFESLEDGNIICWYGGESGFTRTISASTDNGQTWTAYTATSGGTEMVTLNTGDKVFIKGLNDIYYPEIYRSYGGPDGCRFRPTKRHIVYGNIMSLVDGDNFSSSTSMASRSFRYLFYGDRTLISAENLILPATTLSDYCYEGMFTSCSRLTTTPVLSATTLANWCYAHMFQSCSGLTTAPELPATTLADSCYIWMFWYCTSLETAPILSATTLTTQCYSNMFASYTSLNNITCLATNISASGCVYNWLYDVSASGTFTKASSMNDWTTGSAGIPTNWTIQNA